MYQLMTLSFFAVLLVLCTSVVVDPHVCILHKRPNPSSKEMRWSMPRQERCLCQRVVVAPQILGPAFGGLSCPNNSDKIFLEDYWFSKDPAALINRRNWKQARLDQLLERSRCGYEDTTNTNAPSSGGVSAGDDAPASTNAPSSGGVSAGDVAPASTHAINSGGASASNDALASTNAQTSGVVSALPSTNASSSTVVYAISSTNVPSSVIVPTNTPVCDDYLGMESGDIPDENIQASSIHGLTVSALGARLNAETFWVANVVEIQPWIQADIGYQTNVSGVVTQGDGSTRWVTSLKISTFLTSTNDSEIFVKDQDGQDMVFQANFDINTAVVSSFPEPVYAEVVRINCLAKKSGFFAMRFELLGCKGNSDTTSSAGVSPSDDTPASTVAPSSTGVSASYEASASKSAPTSTKVPTTAGDGTTSTSVNPVCDNYLGMQNGDIPDKNIKASSERPGNSASKARLNAGTHWGAANGVSQPWIQADIGYQTHVSGIITQGAVGGRVTSLKVSTFITSTDDTEIFVEDENGQVMVFQTNRDSTTAKVTPLVSSFPQLVYAQEVRITCLSNTSHFSMSFEILGCKQTVPE